MQIATLTDLIGKMVVLRSSASGVWLGRLVSLCGERRVLADARRAWSWEGAASCSGLAIRGPSGGKICEPVSLAIIEGCCETLAATDEAVERWKAVEPWVA